MVQTSRSRPSLVVVAQIPPALREALARDNEIIDHVVEGRPEAIGALPGDAQAIVTRALYGAPPALMDALPDLRVIISLGAGVDRIDQDLLKQRGVELIHTPDELTEDVADYAIGLMYAAQRNILEGDRYVREGRWSQGRFGYSRRVSSRRIGIVGMGRIGGRVAAKAEALGLSVAYLRHRRTLEGNYRAFDHVDDLAKAVDILVLACARSPETHHLVKAATLEALGPQGILINVARGEIVEEDALIKALRSGTIAHAALDVFKQEPTPNPDLLSLPNLILSPHAAALTEETREAMNERLVQSARAYFSRAAA